MWVLCGYFCVWTFVLMTTKAECQQTEGSYTLHCSMYTLQRKLLVLTSVHPCILLSVMEWDSTVPPAVHIYCSLTHHTWDQVHHSHLITPSRCIELFNGHRCTNVPWNFRFWCHFLQWPWKGGTGGGGWPLVSSTGWHLWSCLLLAIESLQSVPGGPFLLFWHRQS